MARLERAIDAAAVALEVRAAIDGLPEGERAVAELVVVEEMTPDEAARALGLRPAAVRMRLARARRKVRLAVGPLLDPPRSVRVEKVVR